LVLRDKEVVKELIQDDFLMNKMRKNFIKSLTVTSAPWMFIDCHDLEKKLGGKGASKRAELIINNKSKFYSKEVVLWRALVG
jgi:lipid-A-disaccharide synthase